MAHDGRYQGTITGFEAQDVYIWWGTRLVRLPLKARSTLLLDGRRVQVWALQIGQRISALVRHRTVVWLKARRVPARPHPGQRLHGSQTPVRPAPVRSTGRVGSTRLRARGVPASVRAGQKRGIRPALNEVSPGSDTWTQTNGSFIAVYGLALDPNNPDHLWIGGNGVLYEGSRSGGQVSWQFRSDYGVNIATDPVTSDRLYRAGGNWVEYSSDAGQSWTTSSTPGLDCSGVLYGVPGQAGVILLGTGCTMGIWRSTDGGQSFGRVDPGFSNDITSFTADPSDSSILYAGCPGRRRSAKRRQWSHLESGQRRHGPV
jgi:hypothetical protein